MTMSPQVVFQVHLACGYAAWLLCLGTAIVPRLQTWDATRVQRAIAMLHSFRFMGLVFILPGIVGALPSSFSTFAAYGDFTTALLAMAALLTARVRGAFWFFVVAFNVVGMTDLVLDYRHAIQVGRPRWQASSAPRTPFRSSTFRC